MWTRELDPPRSRADTEEVTEHPRPRKRSAPKAPAGPGPGDLIQLDDASSARPLAAIVEAAGDGVYAIRFTSSSRLRGRSRARWFDGETAWEAAGEIRDGSAGDHAELAVEEAWEAVPARQSERVAVDRFPLLVEVVKTSSNTHAPGRRFDLLCVDVSATGCRATTPGPGPAVGDVVRVAWVRGDAWTHVEPEWVHARVTRAEARAFGGGLVGFRFDVDAEREAVRVRTWRDAWAAHVARAA